LYAFLVAFMRVNASPTYTGRFTEQYNPKTSTVDVCLPLEEPPRHSIVPFTNWVLTLFFVNKWIEAVNHVTRSRDS
jgi:hypothetical protein